MTTKPRKTKRWKPSPADQFYYIAMPVMPFYNELLMICTGSFGGMIDYDDIIKSGNCFRTRREALSMSRKLLRTLKDGL